MAEVKKMIDPFLNKEVEISTRLVDRLLGKYANGPTMANGEPEFGWRQFDTPPIQHEAAATISRLTAERDGLISALREAFPHFEGEAPVEPEVIKQIGREHVDMIMNWQPATDRIEFLDHHGNTHAIVFDSGDYEAGLPSGWGLEDSSTLVDTTLPDADR